MSRSPRIRSRRFAEVTAALLAVVLLRGSVCVAQSALLENEPYDLLTVNDEGKRTTLKIRLVGLDTRMLPPLEKRRPLDLYQFEIVDGPPGKYEVKWRDVAELKLHEELVLDEARHFMEQGRFDDAYGDLRYLTRVAPDLDGLSAATDAFLFLHANQALKSGDGETAYYLLRELVDRDPNYPGLADRLNEACELTLATLSQKGAHTAARALLVNAAERFRSFSPAALGRWKARFVDEANQLTGQARGHFSRGEFSEAFAAADRAARIWPETPGLVKLTRDIQERYPVIRVAVTSVSQGYASRAFYDWNHRRDARLVGRRLFEFERTGPEGGEYICPAGAPNWSGDARRVSIALPDTLWKRPQGRGTSRDLAMTLLGIDAAFDQQEQLPRGFIQGIAAPRFQEIEIVVAPHLKPEGLLTIPLTSPNLDDLAGGPWRPFTPAQGEDGAARFQANPQYVYASRMSLREIVERPYDDTGQALAALKSGEVDVVDRIPPRFYGQTGQAGGISEHRYGAPLVHVLAPNPNHETTAGRTFRRALLYGINRAGILANSLLSGREIEGYGVLDGPFPAGLSLEDPIRYAFDPALPVRGYEPGLAATLVQVALRESAEALTDAKPGDAANDAKELPALTLAFPGEEFARRACREIQRDLARIGVRVVLEETDDIDFSAGFPDYDLVYLQLAMWDPITDSRQLFGRQGLLRGGSPYLELALDKLDRSSSWRDARVILKEIHRLVQEELTVVPLWQTSERFAIRAELEGLGERPAALFNHVEDWRRTQSRSEGN